MQALVTYILVALAALWVTWSVLLPKSARAAIARTLGRRGASRGLCCSDDAGDAEGAPRGRKKAHPKAH